MNDKQAKATQQRSFLLVYESKVARDGSSVKVESQKNGRNVKISDLDEEQTKKIRQKIN